MVNGLARLAWAVMQSGAMQNRLEVLQRFTRECP
jgi:hypothetical protein